jgi:hypothetical protein
VILIVMPVEAAASELFHQQIQVPNVQTDSDSRAKRT